MSIVSAPGDIPGDDRYRRLVEAVTDYAI